MWVYQEVRQRNKTKGESYRKNVYFFFFFKKQCVTSYNRYQEKVFYNVQGAQKLQQRLDAVLKEVDGHTDY